MARPPLMLIMTIEQREHVKQNVRQSLVTKRPLIGRYDAVKGSILLVQHERQQMVVRVRAVRTGLVDKDAQLAHDIPR